MKKTNFLFGLGTGRCGTVSLAKLLDAQKSSRISHEERPWLPWELNSGLVMDKASSLLDRAEKFGVSIVGDVALFNLQSVEFLLVLIPSAKFIVLKRDKEKTLDSFKRKWQPKYNRIKVKKVEWDHVFPHYDLSLEKAVDKYYTAYYKKAFTLQNKYPDNVKCVNTELLNNKSGIDRILEFCVIPKKERVYKIGITANKGNRG